MPWYGHTDDPIVVHCLCGRVSRHPLSTALARWGEVEEANYREHMAGD